MSFEVLVGVFCLFLLVFVCSVLFVLFVFNGYIYIWRYSAECGSDYCGCGLSCF